MSREEANRDRWSRAGPSRNRRTTPTGKVELTVHFHVTDAAALLAAGQRSYARDGKDWTPGGQQPPIPPDADDVIGDPAQAAVDLLLEALSRCFMPWSNLFVENLEGVVDVEVRERVWQPDAEGGPAANCPACGGRRPAGPEGDIEPGTACTRCGHVEPGGEDL